MTHEYENENRIGKRNIRRGNHDASAFANGHALEVKNILHRRKEIECYPADQKTAHDRQAFHADIARIYQEDHETAMSILQNRAPGWEKAFLEQRRQTMQKVAGEMPHMFQKYSHLLKGGECAPRRKGTYRDRDFRAVLLNADKELGFFTVALIFDPGQSTSPHTHKTLCFGVPYRGATEETLFDNEHKPIRQIERRCPNEIEIASPENGGDLHAVGNPLPPKKGKESAKDVCIQIHLYDGYDLKALLERGVVVPIVTGRSDQKLSGAAESLEIPGFPSPFTGMRA